MTDAIRLSAPGEPAGAALARLRWTSVPRWPALPQLPPAASYLACCFGPEGERQVRALLARADPTVPVRTEAFAGLWDRPGATGLRLRALFGECLTGVRIVLAGPEAAVMRAAAVAKQCGATSEELILIAVEAAAESDYVSGPAPRRVFCAACRAAFDAVAALGAVVTCPGCAGNLIVDHRFSRPHAAYFGWPAGPPEHLAGPPALAAPAAPAAPPNPPNPPNPADPGPPDPGPPDPQVRLAPPDTSR